ncbi:hypothetical protein ACFFWD_24990 [Bradyrhizobium erythrophlei]|uniref:hypothetical protein n=1 Tax=Bradyrhizobium erythrophlei TaxID=1437360 RepID=UPI0035F0553D
MQKTVQIEIAQQDVTFLKANANQLCFARKVNDIYNVVWRASGGFLTSNRFTYSPKYELFASNSVTPGEVVRIGTTLGIRPGEQAVLAESGIFGPPATGGPLDGITLINRFGAIHPGLRCISTGIDGAQIVTPIFVTPQVVVPGDTVLTPADKVLVWFQQVVVQGAVFVQQRIPNAVEIDLTLVNSATRLYRNGGWSQP